MTPPSGPAPDAVPPAHHPAQQGRAPERANPAQPVTRLARLRATLRDHGVHPGRQKPTEGKLLDHARLRNAASHLRACRAALNAHVAACTDCVRPPLRKGAASYCHAGTCALDELLLAAYDCERLLAPRCADLELCATCG